MAARTKLTPERQKEFLELFSKTGNCALSARAIGVNRNSIWYLRERDEAFDEDYKEAEAIALGLLEEEARRRALEGVERPIYQQGNLVGYERVYSDRMLEILLKAHDPQKYRDNQPADPGGVVINLVQFNGEQPRALPAGPMPVTIDAKAEVVVQAPKLTSGSND
jgi:hypothetical protein